jgi:hypothetical protein
MSAEEWTSVLKLSTTWEFPTIRASAIKHLSTMPLKAAEKLLLAHKCHVNEWLLPALNQLAQQETLLEDAEYIAQATSWGYVMKLTKVRESIGENPSETSTAQGCGYSQGQWRCNSCYQYTPLVCGNDCNSRSKIRSAYDFTPIIRTVFDLAS